MSDNANDDASLFQRMEAAQRANGALVEALRMMPDYIEVFRLIRGTTGSKHRDYAKSVADRIEEIRTTTLAKQSPCPDCTGLTAHLPMCPSKDA